MFKGFLIIAFAVMYLPIGTGGCLAFQKGGYFCSPSSQSQYAVGLEYHLHINGFNYNSLKKLNIHLFMQNLRRLWMNHNEGCCRAYRRGESLGEGIALLHS